MVFHTTTISIRMTEELKGKVNDLLSITDINGKPKYLNITHLMRCLIIKEYNEEVGNEWQIEQ